MITRYTVKVVNMDKSELDVTYFNTAYERLATTMF